ncbi:MAG: hypothetical protein U9N44_01615 [Chloroflexota bacterium]|nr:hypothetical protein [Chloroflexota bacterium]
MKTSTQYLIGMGIFTLATVLQGVGVVRYIQRMPDDSVGITLFVVATVAFALGAAGFYFRWVKARRDAAGGSPKGE